MNEKLQIVFGLVGGLAIFIYGMNMMSECLQKAAGEKMKSILALLTRNPVTKPNIEVIRRSEENLAEKIDELMQTALDTAEIIEVK